MYKRAVRIAAPGIESHHTAVHLFYVFHSRMDNITVDSRVLYQPGQMDQRGKTCRHVSDGSGDHR